MKVRLTRKLADRIDDVELSPYAVGDVLNLSQRDAALLVAEGWASPLERQTSSAIERLKADMERIS